MVEFLMVVLVVVALAFVFVVAGAAVGGGANTNASGSVTVSSLPSSLIRDSFLDGGPNLFRISSSSWVKVDGTLSKDGGWCWTSSISNGKCLGRGE